MMYEKGTVAGLEELGNKFIEFAQKGNSTTRKWKLLDDRLSTFFGATLKIPVSATKDKDDSKGLFVTLRHQRIEKDTYATWLRDMEEFKSEKYGHELGGEDVSIVNYTKYGDPNRENPFRNNGHFLAVCTHKFFDRGLWQCEQGGSISQTEDDEQINRLNLLEVHRMFYPRKGKPWEIFVPLPCYPSTGCPWFTISDENIIEYKPEIYGIDYYFVKYNTSALIAIRIHNKGASQDCWQVITFGRIKSVSYKQLTYCAGGNTGISDDVYVYTPIGGSKPTFNLGNSYDLDCKNAGFGNSNPLFPTRFNKSKQSNFKVENNDGEILDVFAYEQRIRNTYTPFCKTDEFNFFSALMTPNNIQEHVPTITHVGIGMIDTHTIKGRLKPCTVSTPLEKVYVFNMLGGLGYMPNFYGTWSKNLGTGEVELSGKKYLSIPNVTEWRQYSYKNYIDLDAENKTRVEKIRNNINSLLSKYDNRHTIYYTMLVPLEEEVE